MLAWMIGSSPRLGLGIGMGCRGVDAFQPAAWDEGTGSGPGTANPWQQLVPSGRLGKTARVADNFGRLTAPHRTLPMVFRY